MGQYTILVNLTRREFISPAAFTDGAKPLDLASGDTPTGLLCLLISGNTNGGTAEFCRPLSRFSRAAQLRARKAKQPLNQIPSPLYDIVGSWAGDRIVLAGDYANDGHLLTSWQRKQLLRVQRTRWKERAAGDKLRHGLYAANCQRLAPFVPTPFTPRCNVYQYVGIPGSGFADVSEKVVAVLRDMQVMGVTEERCDAFCRNRLGSHGLFALQRTHSQLSGTYLRDLTWMTPDDMCALINFVECKADLLRLKRWFKRQVSLPWQQEYMAATKYTVAYGLQADELLTNIARAMAKDATPELLLPSPKYIRAAIAAELAGDTAFLESQQVRSLTRRPATKVRRAVRSATTVKQGHSNGTTNQITADAETT